VQIWLSYQALWDLQADYLYGKLGSGLDRWMKALEDIKSVYLISHDILQLYNLHCCSMLPKGSLEEFVAYKNTCEICSVLSLKVTSLS